MTVEGSLCSRDVATSHCPRVSLKFVQVQVFCLQKFLTQPCVNFLSFIFLLHSSTQLIFHDLIILIMPVLCSRRGGYGALCLLGHSAAQSGDSQPKALELGGRGDVLLQKSVQFQRTSWDNIPEDGLLNPDVRFKKFLYAVFSGLLSFPSVLFPNFTSSCFS